MTELINDLSTDIWLDKGVPPAEEERKNFANYQNVSIYRSLDTVDSKVRTYLLSLNDGIRKAKMRGILRRDPLKDIQVCDVKLVQDGEDWYITGIMLDRCWVEEK